MQNPTVRVFKESRTPRCLIEDDGGNWLWLKESKREQESVFLLFLFMSFEPYEFRSLFSSLLISTHVYCRYILLD